MAQSIFIGQIMNDTNWMFEYCRSSNCDTGSTSTSGETARSTDVSLDASAVECTGCDRLIVSFSGLRSFCVSCTRTIIEEDITREDFADGCLPHFKTSQTVLGEWTSG